VFLTIPPVTDGRAPVVARRQPSQARVHQLGTARAAVHVWVLARGWVLVVALVAISCGFVPAWANGKALPNTTDVAATATASSIAPAGQAVLGKPVDVRVIKQELPQVLQALAEQAGVRVTTGKGLSRTVTNLHLRGTAREALDALAEQIGAIWWWSGNDVRMIDRTDLVTKTLKGRDFEQTLDAARSLGLPVELLATNRADVPGIVRITGPSGLVSEVETLAQDISEQVGRIHVTRFGRRRTATIK
jgi:hypothetical protein